MGKQYEKRLFDAAKYLIDRYGMKDPKSGIIVFGRGVSQVRLIDEEENVVEVPFRIALGATQNATSSVYVITFGGNQSILCDNSEELTFIGEPNVEMVGQVIALAKRAKNGKLRVKLL